MLQHSPRLRRMSLMIPGRKWSWSVRRTETRTLLTSGSGMETRTRSWAAPPKTSPGHCNSVVTGERRWESSPVLLSVNIVAAHNLLLQTAVYLPRQTKNFQSLKSLSNNEVDKCIREMSDLESQYLAACVKWRGKGSCLPLLCLSWAGSDWQPVESERERVSPLSPPQSVGAAPSLNTTHLSSPADVKWSVNNSVWWLHLLKWDENLLRIQQYKTSFCQ